MRFFKYIDVIPEYPIIDGVPGSFQNGDEIKVRKGPSGSYRFEIFKVAADDTIVPSSITADEWNKLSQMTQSEITKLLELKTQSQIDNQINTAIDQANGVPIEITGTVLPQGAAVPAVITVKGMANLYGGTGGTTYTQTGGSSITVTQGKFKVGYYDRPTNLWKGSSLEYDVPQVTGTDVLNPSGNGLPKEKAVANYINGSTIETLFPLGNLPVRRYTSDTVFNDYAAGYSQTVTADGLKMAIPASGSAGVSFWINTGIKSNNAEFTFKIDSLQSTGFIGVGYRDVEGNYIGYMLSKTGILRIINKFTSAILQTTTSSYDVGDIITIKVIEGILTVTKNSVLVTSLNITNNFNGEVCAVQQGFHSYTFKLKYLIDPVGDKIKEVPSVIKEWKPKFYAKGSQVLYNKEWWENILDATETDIPNVDSLIWEFTTDNEKLLVASKNLFDKSTTERGYYNNTGVPTDSLNSIRSPLIEIDNSKSVLSLNQNPTIGVDGRFFFYRADRSFISKIDKPSTQGITIPSNAQFVAFNIYSVNPPVPDAKDNPIVNSLQLEYGLESTSYVNFGEKIDANYLPNSSTLSQGVEMSIISNTLFNIKSTHSNGEVVTHTWQFNQLNPDYDWGWYAPFIIHNGNNIVQGSFNWINMTLFPNENMHVGIGHGCEKQTKCDFYIDGKKIDIDSNVGKSFKGSEFSFDFASEIYAVDSAGSPGSISLPQIPLVLSSRHYMVGGIKSNSKTYNYNKLVIMRDNTRFNRSYSAMHLAYPEFFNRIELDNIENTENNTLTVSPYFTPISPSTTQITNGGVYSTSDGFRAEVGTGAISYSDFYGYIFETRCFAKDPIQQAKMNILAAGTTKLYFNQVITPVTATPRGLTIDSFNKGSVLECYVERELKLK